MSDEKNDEKGARPPLVIELSKQKRKDVKKLRKGEGKLMGEIGEVIDRLVASGDLEPGAQPLVIVVREKDDRKLYGMRLF